MNEIPDHVKPGLSILFIGFNPSLRSAETGHHYANPNNRFYKVLYEAGLTPRLYTADEDQDLLELGYGFTNIVARPTRTAAEIKPEEYRAGRERLKRLIAEWQPQTACFVGKGVYQQYKPAASAAWGWQGEPAGEEAGQTREFVAPSTSGLVRMTVQEIASIYRQLLK
ncbi:mismatch-specific DNA-glycosylase [Paenibacillus senegalensis]|uniref:mismatch-specific DNA-glycosylase n=1 Tax=Paenibacillus senegalensis TaxID=1465766 RepID=UPI000288D365|nr:mismatch-specific DNA-glycosylase [Paenibacillus senegalensis]